MSTSKPAPPDKDRFIVLLRHGIAEEAAASGKDEDRELTKEGEARMREVARGLASILPKPDVIFSSPLVRAIQTARRVAKAYGLEVTETAALRPGGSTKDVAALLVKSDGRRVILVGHEPNLTETLRVLTGLRKAAGIELKKGGCYGIRMHADGSAALEWFLTPRILRRLR